MRALRRRQHGIHPAAIAVVALLAGCGAESTISASPSTPTPAIQPDACSVLSDSDVTAAFTLPTATASAAPAGAEATPAITHVYSVETVSGKQVGRCVWTSDGGAQVMAQVIPNTQLSQLSEYTAGAAQVGPAYIQEGDGRGFVSIQDGSGVLAITLVLDADPATRTAHLADLARVASGAPVPSLSPGAVPTAAAPLAGPAWSCRARPHRPRSSRPTASSSAPPR